MSIGGMAHGNCTCFYVVELVIRRTEMVLQLRKQNFLVTKGAPQDFILNVHVCKTSSCFNFKFLILMNFYNLRSI